ncbi:MAG: hypothetical protein J3Q66DRAFT_432681 [Benniella sp.]|nr:MAG: hypothetical protein J3Q66DRAFT_432681 [Benniella sp.]
MPSVVLTVEWLPDGPELPDGPKSPELPELPDKTGLDSRKSHRITSAASARWIARYSEHRMLIPKALLLEHPLDPAAMMAIENGNGKRSGGPQACERTSPTVESLDSPLEWAPLRFIAKLVPETKQLKMLLSQLDISLHFTTFEMGVTRLLNLFRSKGAPVTPTSDFSQQTVHVNIMATFYGFIQAGHFNTTTFSFQSIGETELYSSPTVNDLQNRLHTRRIAGTGAKAFRAEYDLAVAGILRCAGLDVKVNEKVGARKVLFVYGGASFNTRTKLSTLHTTLKGHFFKKASL